MGNLTVCSIEAIPFSEVGYISLHFLWWKVTHCWWERNASPVWIMVFQYFVSKSWTFKSIMYTWRAVSLSRSHIPPWKRRPSSALVPKCYPVLKLSISSLLLTKYLSYSSLVMFEWSILFSPWNRMSIGAAFWRRIFQDVLSFCVLHKIYSSPFASKSGICWTQWRDEMRKQLTGWVVFALQSTWNSTNMGDQMSQLTHT